MVLYRLFVLAWVAQAILPTCWKATCLPCRRFTKDVEWQSKNCDIIGTVHTSFTIQTYNETTQSCQDTDVSFGVLETGAALANCPYESANTDLKRPVRITIKAGAACRLRHAHNFTHGAVRVFDLFGVRLENSQVFAMFNGTWFPTAIPMDGNFFDDGFGEDGEHEFVFELLLGLTRIYYNEKLLVSTQHNYDVSSGNIHLDGASASWLNWVVIQDDDCEIECSHWDCSGAECICIDRQKQADPPDNVIVFESIEENNDDLLGAILSIMTVNVALLMGFFVCWKCFVVRGDETDDQNAPKSRFSFSRQSLSFAPAIFRASLRPSTNNSRLNRRRSTLRNRPSTMRRRSHSRRNTLANEAEELNAIKQFQTDLKFEDKIISLKPASQIQSTNVSLVSTSTNTTTRSSSSSEELDDTVSEIRFYE